MIKGKVVQDKLLLLLFFFTQRKIIYIFKLNFDMLK